MNQLILIALAFIDFNTPDAPKKAAADSVVIYDALGTSEWFQTGREAELACPHGVVRWEGYRNTRWVCHFNQKWFRYDDKKGWVYLHHD